MQWTWRPARSWLSPRIAEPPDTTTVKETVIEAGIAVAGLIAEKTPEGEYEVHPEGVKEVVADKGYHSNDVMVGLAEMEVRSYVAEPDRGPRNWDGKQEEKQAVHGNRLSLIHISE